MSSHMPPGWYTDRLDPSRQRWWDGAAWSPVTRFDPSAQTVRSGAGQVAGGSTVVEPSAPGAGPIWGRAEVPPGPAVWGAPGVMPGVQGAPGAPGMTGVLTADGRWAAAPTTPDGMLIAGAGVRLLARVIDGIVTLMLTLLFSLSVISRLTTLTQAMLDRIAALGAAPDDAAVRSIITETLTSAEFTHAAFVVLVVQIAVTGLYSVACISQWGATLGKAMLGLRVRAWDAPGAPGVRRALMRWLAREPIVSLVSYLGTFYGLVDAAWILRDPRRQALHDKAAGTVVVRVR